MNRAQHVVVQIAEGGVKLTPPFNEIRHIRLRRSAPSLYQALLLLDAFCGSDLPTDVQLSAARLTARLVFSTTKSPVTVWLDPHNRSLRELAELGENLLAHH